MELVEIPAAKLDPIERTVFSLRLLYSSYGYTQYKMGKFEEYDFYSRNKDFLVSDGVITFTDTNGKLMALKPDVTLSIVKNDRESSAGTRKLYYDENVYRVSKGNSMFREIKQTGLECIGDVDTYHVGEVLLLAAKSLQAVSEDFVLVVSELGILSAFVEAVSDNPDVCAEIMKCVGEKNLHGIDGICEQNAIPSERAASLKALLSLYGSPEHVLSQIAAIPGAPEVSQQIKRLRETLGIFRDSGLGDRVQIDFSVTGDLNYYNGIIFKGFVSGVPSSLLSGGQYDRLMEKLGRRSSAIGFAVYLDMLEHFGDSGSDVDVDVMLVYGASADVAGIGAAVERFAAEGRSVAALPEIDTKKKYRTLARYENGVVTVLENNA